ncbi:MAG: hypothetical protein KAI67_06315 [Candidatus Pacebacteria bacterium]|nr:hypothetical protein [Candidatus Paceibacterota bacterium]
MSKLYKCAKECGSIEESDNEKIPTCCEEPMKETTEEELFSCPGCSDCHGSCGISEQ